MGLEKNSKDKRTRLISTAAAGLLIFLACNCTVYANQSAEQQLLIKELTDLSDAKQQTMQIFADIEDALGSSIQYLVKNIKGLK